MPLYEYRCQACGHTFEDIRPAFEDALIPCDTCGKAEAKRLVSAVHLKTNPHPLKNHKDFVKTAPHMRPKLSGGCGGGSCGGGNFS